MGSDLYDGYVEYRTVFDRAEEILGYNLASLCLAGPSEELARTVITQPAVFTSSVATLAIIRERIGRPRYAAGHSLGEYAAAYAAGVFNFENGLRIVARRAELMEEAALFNPGKMLAVLGADTSAVERAVNLFSQGKAAVANYNSPGQVVVSVDAASANELSKVLAGAGARRVVELPVGGAFHSPMMEEAAAKFADFLAPIDFAEPCFPLVINASAEPETDPGIIKEAFALQITGPVRWEESIKRMMAEGVAVFMEVGPGQVLTKLNARIAPDALSLCTCDKNRVEETIKKLEGRQLCR